VPLERRVGEALAEVRPYLESHGGNVELLGVDAGVVRIQLQGSCSGCPSSAVTLKLAVEEAIHKAAPDVTEIVAVDAPPAPAPLIALEVYEACPAPLHR
jgi:Fe-S cluster biogenesis protein NfuA